MAHDPTGAARTAPLPYGVPSSPEMLALWEDSPTPLGDVVGWVRRLLRAQHAATLSHLAGQAGPAVRGLVDAVAGDCLDTAYSAGQRLREKPDCDCPACTDVRALLAAYAAKDAELTALKAEPTEVDAEMVADLLREHNYRGPHETTWAAYQRTAEAIVGLFRAGMRALRQQRDEAVNSLTILGESYKRLEQNRDGWMSAEAKALAEAASERQRAERAEAQIACQAPKISREDAPG